LVATQGQGDEEALELALNSSAAHVLMIASRRKAQRLREVMRMRGIDEVHLARLTAPAGPDAGAKTPGEIALVAIVGVLAVLRGRAEATPAAKAYPAADDASVPAPLPSSSHDAVDAAAQSTKFVNPVCGIAVDTATPKHIENYEGVAYYFCCDGCLTTFRKDPAKYAAIHGASAGVVPA
jgi:xanthine dehydrogenase accessory factor